MKNAAKILILFFVIVVCSCQDEPQIINKELFEISINARTSNLIISNGRTSEELPEISSLSFWLFNESCSEIDRQSMFGDSLEESILLPSLSAGTYSYLIRAYGENGIQFGKGITFDVTGDTTLEANLENYQTRIKIVDSSGFDEPTIGRIEYNFKVPEYKYFIFPRCSEDGYWSMMNPNHFLTYNMHPPAPASAFYYEHPFIIEFILVKFYDLNDDLVRSTIISLGNRWINEDVSYTFEVNVQGLWNDSENGRLYISISEKEWTEETIVID